jgi:hypothetical protein
MMGSLTPVDAIYFYNMAANTWCLGPTRLPTTVSHPFAQVIQGKFYLLDDTGRLWEGAVY